MKPGRLSLLMACALSLGGVAQAAGFGELSLHSRIGEKLRADVPVSLADNESVDSRCFSLIPPSGNDLPPVTRARLTLSRQGNGKHVLQIEGSQNIDEPLLVLGLRLGCGIDLQRDYVLMPEAAPARREMQADAPSTASSQTRYAKTVSAGEETLSENPRPRAIAKPAARPAPKPRPTAARGDRLMIGTSPSDTGMRNAELAYLGEMENRMLRMESSLHTLHDEVEQLRLAVELGAQAMTARHELKLAQNLEIAALPPTAAGNPEPASGGKWLELLLGTLAGGALAALLVFYLSRRQTARQARA